MNNFSLVRLFITCQRKFLKNLIPVKTMVFEIFFHDSIISKKYNRYID